MATVGEGMVSKTGVARSTASDKQKGVVLSVEVLQIIKEAQQQHGLRHGDFQRYRSYCSRRLRRIRKSLHFPQGDKRRVVPKKINIEVITDVRYLHLPLFCAERAWGYAMQLKSEANTEPRKKFHMIARLKKALAYAEELSSLCESEKCDARTKLETQAYRSFMKGSLEFEVENWKAAIESYNSAKTIYEKLASAFTEDVQTIYLQRVSEVEPNIRYCAYNIGDESAIKDLMQMRLTSTGGQLSLDLDNLLSQTREKQAATLSEVSWRGRTVPVKNEPVRVFLLNLKESSQQIDKVESLDSKISIYESILKQCIDTQQVLRDSLQEDQNFKAALRGQPIDGKVSNQHYLHSYLSYIKLSKTIDRNLLMIKHLKQFLPGQKVKEGRKISKPQDLVRLYDIIIQNLGEIPNLPGVEEDHLLSEEMSTRISGFKAFRCFYVAQFYTVARKWKESIGLYDRVLTYAGTALKGYSSMKDQAVLYQKEKSSLEDLVKEADSLKYSCHASSILDTEQVTDDLAALNLKNNKPLIDRLEQYLEDPKLATKKASLVSFPPDFTPIPCRPLFFDLALNHLDFPDLGEKLEQKKAAGGITGFVKGWFWGGKK